MNWAAEVGSAHKGNKSLAYEYIRRYAQAGATLIKFQFGWTKEAQEAMGLEYNPVRYVDEWADDLYRWCDERNVELMASIWSEEGLRTAEDCGIILYKIGAQMYKRNPEFADKVRMDHETLITGVNVFGISVYPTYPDLLMASFPQRFERYGVRGYSDHTHGIAACLLAVARGAMYIEKHVALDKTDLVTRDTPFSATPEEYAEMVRIGNEMERLYNAQP